MNSYRHLFFSHIVATLFDPGNRYPAGNSDVLKDSSCPFLIAVIQDGLLKINVRNLK